MKNDTRLGPGTVRRHLRYGLHICLVYGICILYRTSGGSRIGIHLPWVEVV